MNPLLLKTAALTLLPTTTAFSPIIRTTTPLSSVMKLRRSPRFLTTTVVKGSPVLSSSSPEEVNKNGVKRKSSSISSKKPPKKKKSVTSSSSNYMDVLPRIREEEICKTKSSNTSSIAVMGIDEAGRGPLAGPVVAAAAIIPNDIPGVIDSKKITKEEKREELYDLITNSPNARWAVSIVDAKRIDEINILQATLEAMENASRALIFNTFNNDGSDDTSLSTPTTCPDNGRENESIMKIVASASADIDGCYVISQWNDSKGNPLLETSRHKHTSYSKDGEYFALVDGNRIPKNMPCNSESVVKGDSKEYSIAAASILAKVTRDRIMHEYDALFPEYNLAQHKGYPTKKHMSKVREHGASPIHRLTFAPLKHMSFDKDGNLIEESD